MSKSSRGTVSDTGSQQCVPLPVWVSTSASFEAPPESGGLDNDEFKGPGEIWEKKRMSTDHMKEAVADFLLDDLAS
jgi:hypothetical protein